MDSKILELPNSWVAVKLGDFVENEKGKKPKNESKIETASHHFPYVDIHAFEQNVVRTWTDGVGCRLCYETDFLMVWDGSRSGLVGKGIVPSSISVWINCLIQAQPEKAASVGLSAV